MIAASASWWWRYEQEALPSGPRPSTQELDGLVVAHPGLRESIIYVAGANVPSQEAVIVFLHRYINDNRRQEIDAEMVDTFVSSLGSGASLNERDPVLLLRNNMMDWLKARRKPYPHVIAATILKAWNLYATNQRPARLLWAGGRGEEFPKIIMPSSVGAPIVAPAEPSAVVAA
jgi:hypothetical protein